MSKKRFICQLFLLLALGILSVVPAISFATDLEYTVLAPVENFIGDHSCGPDGKSACITLSDSGRSFGEYLNDMYRLGIALCGALAVLMIVIGGVQYVSSDAWTGKEAGKERITAALLGLAVALGSYAMLMVLNPNLLNTTLSIGRVDVDPFAWMNPTVLTPTSAFVTASGNYFTDADFSEGTVITANNIALDTDGISNPGIDPTTHQGETSLPGLDSTVDSYVAVPTSAKIPMGTPVLITNTTTGQTVQAIAGDNGATGWGEMSIAAARQFGFWKPGQGDSMNVPPGQNITFTIGKKRPK